jgi:hypothetical protein
MSRQLGAILFQRLVAWRGLWRAATRDGQQDIQGKREAERKAKAHILLSVI